MENDKCLGKISSAEFGVVSDYPFLIGLKLTFSGDSWGVGDGGKYTMNLTAQAWKDDFDKRGDTAVEKFQFVQDLLKAAKVENVSGLIGKPVEVTFENRIFKSFRILTEVL